MGKRGRDEPCGGGGGHGRTLVDGRPYIQAVRHVRGPLTNGAQNNFPGYCAHPYGDSRGCFTRARPDGSEGYWWFPRLTYINSIGGSLNYSVSYLINNCHSEPSLRVIVGSGAGTWGRQLAYCIEYTKAVDAPTYYHLPYLVLPSARWLRSIFSSEFSSGYYNVYAFGGSGRALLGVRGRRTRSGGYRCRCRIS